MRLKKTDVIFIVAALAVLAIFFLISGEEKTTRMPKDETHQQFYDMRQRGMEKIAVDAQCPACHDGSIVPFPPDHPLKPGSGPMRCLFCHKLEPQ